MDRKWVDTGEVIHRNISGRNSFAHTGTEGALTARATVVNIRPIVAPADSVLEITFTSKSSQMGVVTLDNTSFAVPVGSKFTLRKAPYSANCITFHNAGFIDALKDKLLWGEDKRNNF